MKEDDTRLASKVTEEQLIDGCRNNDWVAQKELYSIYAPKMLSVCLKYLKNRELAEDALQEGFMLVFNKIESYGKLGSFEGWLRRIFVNVSCDNLRREKILQLNDQLDEASTFTDKELNALEKIESEELVNSLTELPDHYRVALSLHAIEGFTFEEMAEMLKIKTSACKATYYRARQCFGDLLRSKSLI